MALNICKCLRCGHEWAARKTDGQPVKCPKCGSPYWDKPRRADMLDEPEESGRATDSLDKIDEIIAEGEAE